MKTLNVAAILSVFFQITILKLYSILVGYEMILDEWMVFFDWVSLGILSIAIPVYLIQYIKK